MGQELAWQAKAWDEKLVDLQLDSDPGVDAELKGRLRSWFVKNNTPTEDRKMLFGNSPDEARAAILDLLKPGSGSGGGSGLSGNFHPLRRVISVEALVLVERAVFLIKGFSSAAMGSSGGSSSGSKQMGGSSSGASTDVANYVGVGVFVAKNRAVTAAHNLQTAAVGSTVDIYIPEQRRKLQVQVAVRNDELDYAVLEFQGEYSHHLPLYTGNPDSLRGEALALCAFQLGIHEEMPECSTSMGVMDAKGVKLSKNKNHLVYTSQTWPGDSGAALVMYEGELVGLHVAGVNALCEAFNRKCDMHERLTAVEDSLEQAARSVASGCMALLSRAFADHINTLTTGL